MTSGIRNQFSTLKENWLLVVFALVILFVIPSINSGSLSSGVKYSMGAAPAYEMAVAESPAYRGGSYGGIYIDTDFAPEVEERIITKTAYFSSEVARGDFQTAHTQVKSIVNTADGFLLDESVHKYGEGLRQYYTANYQIKVETSKYTDVLNQLKSIGEVDSFTENMDDITGRYTNLEVEIEVEKERLERYEEMYGDAVEVADKINLNDRIFNQERRIKYLERSLANMDTRVEYSTISFTLTEKTSDFAGLSRLSDFVRTLVGSFNSMVSLLFFLIPWALFIGIIWFVYKRFKA